MWDARCFDESPLSLFEAIWPWFRECRAWEWRKRGFALVSGYWALCVRRLLDGRGSGQSGAGGPEPDRVGAIWDLCGGLRRSRRARSGSLRVRSPFSEFPRFVFWSDLSGCRFATFFEFLLVIWVVIFICEQIGCFYMCSIQSRTFFRDVGFVWTFWRGLIAKGILCGG